MLRWTNHNTFLCYNEILYSSVWTLLYCVLSCAYARSASPASVREDVAHWLRHVRLSPELAAMVPRALSEVQLAMQVRFPGCKAELYGSMAAGLGTIYSDIDISIQLQPGDPVANKTDADLVLEAEVIMRQHPHTFEVIRAIPDKNVPMLMVKHLLSGFKVDITFVVDSVWIARLTRHLMSLDGRARDLAQTLKYWGRLHGVEGYRVLSSLAIVTMAIFYLQQEKILPTIASLQINADTYIVDHWNIGFTKDKYESRNNESICGLLGGFFRFDDYMVSPYLGYPIEIELFRDWRTVPEEFHMYRINMENNIIVRVLNLKYGPILKKA